MKRIKTIAPALALGGLLAAPLPSLAANGMGQESGFFLGGGAIYTRIDNQFYSSPDFPSDDDEFDDDRVSWKALAGYRFSPALALEAQYIDFGKASNDIASAEADGWTAAVIAGIPFPFVHPYAKAGALFWDTKASLGPVSGKNDGTDFFWGVGARVPLGEAVDLRLEYERFQLDGDNIETDIDAASLNLQFNFGAAY